MRLASFQTGALCLLPWFELASPLEYFQFELVVHMRGSEKSFISLPAKNSVGRNEWVVTLTKVNTVDKRDETQEKTIIFQNEINKYRREYPCEECHAWSTEWDTKKLRFQPSSKSKEPNQVVEEPSQRI
uniref:AlNc14C11G1391 protein n=1 Tax=Albugo laibachii Nc14 TaxID=890382 RepID=F0W312_9STRA|nr:AlNc14C11G1391 [Albugo laibachii Nc14]|eukprot:CCA15449.1 AlNc14C11G1391 [Albugo laibachii Nc14]